MSAPVRRAAVNRRTVLILAHECAPFNRRESTIGAQRPAQFAKYLPDFGWRTIVLCCDATATEYATPATVDGLVADALDRSRLEPSIVIPIPAFPHDGWIDFMWRLVQRGQPPQVRWRAVVRKALTFAKLSYGDYSQAWQPAARRATQAVVERLGRVDVCIGEHSPDSGLRVARWASDTYGVPWVADFRDPVLQSLPRLARRVRRPLVRRLLSTASAVVNVTPRWVELDARDFGRPTFFIPNGFDEVDFPLARRDVGPRFLVAYLGNINDQTRLDIFFDGLRIFREAAGESVVETFRFAYRGQAAEYVFERALRAGVRDLVDVQGYVDRHEALTLMTHADALLLLSVKTESHRDEFWSDGVYPGKTFEYIGARRPILCVPGDDGQLEELLTRTRTGVVLRSAESVAASLASLWSAWRDGRSSPYEPDESQVATYTRRNLARRLAALLDSITGQ